MKGTLNVLKSCAKATTVKRIVFTSSCSAIRYRADIQQISPLNESHWSDAEYCKNHNVRKHLFSHWTFSYQIIIFIMTYHFKCLLFLHKLWYAYAKTLAEQSAWQMAKESGLNLVVVNPSFVIGPVLGPQPTSTLLLLLGIIKGRGADTNLLKQNPLYIYQMIYL